MNNIPAHLNGELGQSVLQLVALGSVRAESWVA